MVKIRKSVDEEEGVADDDDDDEEASDCNNDDVTKLVATLQSVVNSESEQARSLSSNTPHNSCRCN